MTLLVAWHVPVIKEASLKRVCVDMIGKGFVLTSN